MKHSAQKKIQAFDDTISEKMVKEQLGLGSEYLRRMRKAGTIKNWRALAGQRNIVYSKTELAKVFDLTTNFNA